MKYWFAAIDGLLLRLHNRIAREQALVENVAHELRTPLAAIVAKKDGLGVGMDGDGCQFSVLMPV